MRHDALLSFTLVPAGLLFVVSLVNIFLITHSWVLGDWMIIRWKYDVDPDFVPPSSLGKVSKAENLFQCYATPGVCPDTLIDFTMAPTNAAVASTTISLMASTVALLAYLKLKKSKMDMEINLPRRRFWVGFVSIVSIAVIASAFASFILHYTSVGSNENKCTIEKSDGSNHLEWCTREMGACNLVPAWRRQLASLSNFEQVEKGLKLQSNRIHMACTETRAIKYMQIIVAIIAVALIALINWQATARRKTRYERLTKGDSGRPYH